MNVCEGYGLDVWTMDHEGYGKSARTAGNSDVASGVEDLKAASEVVVRETGQPRAHFYGGSSGALRAAGLALARPERADRPILQAFPWTGTDPPTPGHPTAHAAYSRSRPGGPRARGARGAGTGPGGRGGGAPVSRRGVLGGPVAGGAGAARLGGAVVLPGVAEGAEPAPAGGGPGAAGVSFKWFGTNGWEITFGNKTILVDPWVNRFESGFLQNKLNHDTLLPTDTALIEQHLQKRDQILVGHGHRDS